MQIVPFLTHYQLVYANFDFSSFSLISYTAKAAVLHYKSVGFAFAKEPLLQHKSVGIVFRLCFPLQIVVALHANYTCI